VRNGKDYFHELIERLRDGGVSVHNLTEAEAMAQTRTHDETSDSSLPEEE
jgi:hypothetical protein